MSSTSSGWREVSRAEPCRICGHHGWCVQSSDGAAICRRVEGGLAKLDRNRDPFWFYAGNGQGPVVAPCDLPAEPLRAPPETLDAVYCAVLGRLALAQRHRDDLRRRGLSDVEIDRRHYRSLPRGGREGLLEPLVAQFGWETLATVPGCRRNRSRAWFGGDAGIVIPVRDLDGRVIALRVRTSDPDRKYGWVSSRTSGGPGPGSPVHAPIFTGDRRVIRVTEGSLKADLATVWSGVWTLGLAGLWGHEQLVAFLREIGPELVLIAYDADACTNEHVGRACARLWERLKLEGFVVALESWDASQGKGIDDLLAGGGAPVRLTGAKAEARVMALANEARPAGGVPEVGGSANTANIARGVPPPRWEPPILFPEVDLPEFPVTALPCWLRQFVEAVAEATQTPIDLAAQLALAACSLAVAKRAVIEIKPGYREPLNLWTLCVTRPGSRSSQVLRDIRSPIDAWERRERARMEPEIAAAKARHENLRKRIERTRDRAARETSTFQREDLEREVEQLSRDLTRMGVPPLPRLLADDTTAERLASLIAEHGRMAILSTEGEIFELVAGRYSGNGSPNLGIYLKGHAGDRHTVDRVGRSNEDTEEPILTIGLRVQPAVLRQLEAKEGFRGKGFLARFLYSLPQDLLGRRRINPRPVTDDVRETYHARMDVLLNTPQATDDEGTPAEHVLRLSQRADHLWDALSAWLEPHLATWGELGSMSDWAGKLAGAAGRAAGVLHLAERIGDGEPWNEKVSPETMHRAIAMAQYYIPHARTAFGEMGLDRSSDDAKHLLAWILRRGEPIFTKRDAFEGVKGRFQRVEVMEPALRLLEKHNFIRGEQSDEPRGPGRPSVRFEVNPLAQNPQDPQKPPHLGGFANTANFARGLRPDRPALTSAGDGVDDGEDTQSTPVPQGYTEDF